MAKKTIKVLRDTPTPQIIRNYDPYSMEARIHNLEENAGGGGATSWDYSTDEVDTGQKWTDGKEIYCKVLHGTFNMVANTALVLTGMPNIETLIDVAFVKGNSIARPQVYVYNDNYQAYNYANFDATDIILRYTK